MRNSVFFNCFWMVLLPVMLVCFIHDARGQYNFFYGKVIDAETKAGIKEVNLSIEGTRVGTVTDKSGAFSFFIDSIPAVLVVSCVGYKTKTILLDETSFSLTVYLNREVKLLQEVEIRAQVHEAFFKDDHYAVLDYEIDSNLVYLLVFKQRISASLIVCKNLNGDTVAKSLPFAFRPNRLIRDCLHYLHVLSPDSGFQLFRKGDELHLIHPVNLKKFDYLLKNCVAATPEILYFQQRTDLGLGMEYYGINRQTYSKKYIGEVKDEKKMKMVRRNANDAALLGSEMHPTSREDFVTWNYVHKILYRPVKTALYKIGNFICIFNTVDRQMEFYDHEGKFSCKISLGVDKINDGRWTGDILYDEETGEVYTTFISNGRYGLYEIDLNSGQLKKRLSLFHVFPEKIRVHKGYVYYLYDVSSDPDNKMLFRHEL